MFCPKCGRNVAIADAICGGCDFILDTSFLGVGITDDEQSQRLHRAKGKDVLSPWDDLGNDSLILGNLSDHVASFHSSDTGLQDDRRIGMQLYVGTAIQAMLSPYAVPVVQHEAMNESVRLNPFERHVLGLADGTQPVSRLLPQSGLNREELYTALATLADKGYLKLREENTVVAPVSFIVENEGARSAYETGDGDATEVADLALGLEEIRRSHRDNDQVDENVFADPDDFVFAEQFNEADLHHVAGSEAGNTVAELVPQLSAEDVPSLVAEQRALAFADGLISEERTTIEDIRSRSRSKSVRSHGGRAGRHPPPLPKREGASHRSQEQVEDAAPSNPSGGWLVESNPAAVAADPAAPAAGERGVALAPPDAFSATAVGEMPEAVDALSVNFSSVFGNGDPPIPDSMPADPLGPDDEIDPDDVFATSEPSPPGDKDTPPISPAPIDVLHSNDVLTGVVRGTAASRDEFPSVIPTQSSQDGVPLSLPPEHVAAHTKTPADINAPAESTPKQHNTDPTPAPTDASPGPLPGAGIDLASAAMRDNVFVGVPASSPVRPAFRYEARDQPPETPPKSGVAGSLAAQARNDPLVGDTSTQEVAESAALPPRPASPQPSAVSFEYRRKAEKIFEEAEADFAEGRIGSARMNARLAAIYNPHEPKYQEVLERWEMVSAADAPPVQQETPVRRLVDEAKKAERQGNYPKAVQLLRDALEIDPKAAPLYNHLGVMLATRLHEFQDASAAIMRAIELAPQNLAYKNNLGKILARQAENDDSRGIKGLGRTGMNAGAVMVKNIRPKIY